MLKEGRTVSRHYIKWSFIGIIPTNPKTIERCENFLANPVCVYSCMSRPLPLPLRPRSPLSPGVESNPFSSVRPTRTNCTICTGCRETRQKMDYLCLYMLSIYRLHTVLGAAGSTTASVWPTTAPALFVDPFLFCLWCHTFFTHTFLLPHRLPGILTKHTTQSKQECTNVVIYHCHSYNIDTKVTPTGNSITAALCNRSSFRGINRSIILISNSSRSSTKQLMRLLTKTRVP